MKFTFDKESKVVWHNLMEDSNDLPPKNIPTTWYLCLLFECASKDNTHVEASRYSFMVCDCLYSPCEKKWYATTLDVDENDDSECVYRIDTNKRFKIIEPFTKVAMWAEYPMPVHLVEEEPNVK